MNRHKHVENDITSSISQIHHSNRSLISLDIRLTQPTSNPVSSFVVSLPSYVDCTTTQFGLQSELDHDLVSSSLYLLPFHPGHTSIVLFTNV